MSLDKSLASQITETEYIVKPLKKCLFHQPVYVIKMKNPKEIKLEVTD